MHPQTQISAPKIRDLLFARKTRSTCWIPVLLRRWSRNVDKPQQSFNVISGNVFPLVWWHCEAQCTCGCICHSTVWSLNICPCSCNTLSVCKKRYSVCKRISFQMRLKNIFLADSIFHYDCPCLKHISLMVSPGNSLNLKLMIIPVLDSWLDLFCAKACSIWVSDWVDIQSRTVECEWQLFAVQAFFVESVTNKRGIKQGEKRITTLTTTVGADIFKQINSETKGDNA